SANQVNYLRVVSGSVVSVDGRRNLVSAVLPKRPTIITTVDGAAAHFRGLTPGMVCDSYTKVSRSDVCKLRTSDLMPLMHKSDREIGTENYRNQKANHVPQNHRACATSADIESDA